jgi:hypothetical protein
MSVNTSPKIIDKGANGSLKEVSWGHSKEIETEWQHIVWIGDGEKRMSKSEQVIKQAIKKPEWRLLLRLLESKPIQPDWDTV